jgi:hypothetical protein
LLRVSGAFVNSVLENVYDAADQALRVAPVPYNEEYGYDLADTELYKTDGYNGSDPDIDSTTRYTEDINLTASIGATIDFKFDGSGGTDDLILSLYKRRDSNWDGDEIAIWSVTIDSDGSEDIYHFTIDESYGAGHFRFGMRSSGQTDTFEMDAEMCQWLKTYTIM